MDMCILRSSNRTFHYFAGSYYGSSLLLFHMLMLCLSSNADGTKAFMMICDLSFLVASCFVTNL